MKKSLLLLLSLVLFLPIFVLADAAAPDFISYKVEIANKDGAGYYDYDGVLSGTPIGTLEKGTELTVEYETAFQRVEYVAVKYDKKIVFIKASDVVAVGEFSTKNKNVASYEREQKIKFVDEVVVRKGPSSLYPEAGTIKKGETTFKYYIVYPHYIYVDYKGVKGWIDPSDAGILFGGYDYIAYKEITNSCGTIPKNTILEEIWTSSLGDFQVEVEYKGCKFTKIDSDLARISAAKKVYRLNKDKTFNDLNGKEVTLKKDDEIFVLTEPRAAYDSDYYYIEAGMNKGWIDLDLPDDAKFVREIEIKKKDSKKDDDDDEEKEIKIPVIAGVVIAVSFLLGALITLILLNRKKNKNEKGN